MGQPSRIRITWREYCQLPDDRIRYEVLDGDLVMTPAPDFAHQRVATNLCSAIDRWRRTHDPRGTVLTAPFDVILAFTTIVQPDLLYISEASMGHIVKGRLRGPPDLAIEIFGRRRALRDRVTKRRIYATFGIPEYWLVDLHARSVSILALQGGEYEDLATGRGRTLLASARLRGLAIRPQDVFAGVDRVKS